MIDVAVPPYRVEWRPNLVVRWSLVGPAGTRERADALARESLAKWGGYCRLIAQHVIESSDRPGRWDSPPAGPLLAACAAPEDCCMDPGHCREHGRAS